ncbi:elongation factor G [Anaeromyxobacter diazotrophicus]|uniref:Elongation factor G n=1 Tax=Anaeromyxobacter diazotrophicus TaxID=2590199 RepID=A0A7I9VIS5_9BACT|nr:elongation factor G [Anaeromyxobacter diazotrophicus]GEJ56316.1 elongation factor G [Anaeromyxobacter diazotrophicus]
MPSHRTIRTFCITGADGSGKTALVEALLHASDPKRAAPDGSTARLDAEPEEKKRNFTLSIHPETFEEGGRTFNVLDTPGFASFMAEVDWALRVSDGALLVVSAAEGAHNHAERHFDVLADSKLPALGVIGRLDHERADFQRVLADVERSLNVKPIPLQLPIGEGPALKGLVDVLAGKAHLYDKGFARFTEAEIPAPLRAQAEAARTAAMEAAAECDDTLLGKYLEGGALTGEEIVRGLALGAATQRFLPVAVVAAKPGVGVKELLDLVVALLPPPEARALTGKTPHGDEVKVGTEGPFVGQVFRTTIDHFAGRVDYVRVFAGTLRPDAVLVNPRTRTEERVSHFYKTDGAQTAEVKEAGPGDIVVLMKLKDARTGDTLCDRERPVQLPEFPAPNRPVAFAVHTKGADDKAAAALHKLIEEDPSLELGRSPDTGEMLLKGMGQAHVEVTVERVKRKHGVDMTLGPPTAAYLETITTAAKAQGKFKRQTGGHGQYGDAHVELSPRGRGEGFEFEDAIVGGSIPRQFIPSVEKGIRGALAAGPLAGYPVVDFKAKLVFGTYHDVDSSDMAFQVAGSMAFKKAVLEARPILLEPIMKLEVRVPEEYVGAVMGDLNSRRAKVQGMEPLARGVLVRALCPHAEAMSYDADLRSLTQGVGYFTMEPSHYEPVPPPTAQKIIERRRAEGKVKGLEE